MPQRRAGESQAEGQPLAEEAEVRADFRPGWGMGTSQESKTMAETHHAGLSGRAGSGHVGNVGTLPLMVRGDPVYSASTPDWD